MWGQALGEVGRVIGMGLGQSVDSQQQEYYQRAYGAGYSATYSTPISDDPWRTPYIDDTEAEEVRLKVEEPPDEFTRLSNHGFHELLDRFNKLT